MPPRMTTRSAGRVSVAPRGGRRGGRTGRGGGRTRGRSGDQGNGGIDGQGGQVGGQGTEVNDGVDGVPDFSTVIEQKPINERQIQTTEENVDTSNALDASLVDIESSGTTSGEQDTTSRSGNDTHANDADIRPIYDEEPMAE
ncbi:hypothetical protein Tco_1223177, partial [Tanacetum coccineum]